MHFLEAALLGIVEGLTEFLPVSSTGHLILASRGLGIPSSEFLSTFLICIQSGAMLAVLFLYGPVLWVSPNTLKKVSIAFLPAAILGFFLHGFIKNSLLGNPWIVVASLALGGVVMILFERLNKNNKASANATVADLSYKKAFGIGLCQALALIPGVSRSAATILGGMGLGLDRKSAVEFSFLLAIPTLLGATGLDLVKSSPEMIFSHASLFAVGISVSFVVAFISMKFFLRYIQSHTLAFFGYYRLVLAAVYLLWSGS